MTKLVLDSNAMRRGQFSLPVLQAWIEAGGSAADIVIPEVVIWEWAEHAWAAHAALRTQLQEFRVDPIVVEKPTLEQIASKADIVREIEAALPREVTVWRPSKDDLRDALKDQVLQLGNGERKQGVKTGAADSTVLACVRDQIGDRRNAEAVVLATNDDLLRQACAERFPNEVLLVAGTADLLKKLRTFEPARDELNEAVEESIKSQVTDGDSPIATALATLEMGFRFSVDPVKSIEDTDHASVPTKELVSLGRIDIVELHDLLVTDPHGVDRVGLADLRIFADLKITQLELRKVPGDDATWAVAFDGDVPGGYIDLQVEVRFDAHWEVVSVSPSGEALIHFDDEESEESDAHIDEGEAAR